MIVKLNRTVTDFCGLSPFGSVTDRRTGPDFLRTVRLGAKGRQGRIQRTGADRGTGYCTPLTGGQSVPVRWVRPASWGGPAMGGWGLKI